MATNTAVAQGYYEPSLTLVVLPRCPSCRSPHPLAIGSDPSICPGCGGPPASPKEPVEVEATYCGEQS